MTVDEVLAQVRTNAADLADDDVHVLAEEVERLRADLAAAPKAERERLAAWIEEHANDLRSLAPDGLQIESIAFLLRLAGE